MDAELSDRFRECTVMDGDVVVGYGVHERGGGLVGWARSREAAGTPTTMAQVRAARDYAARLRAHLLLGWHKAKALDAAREGWKGRRALVQPGTRTHGKVGRDPFGDTVRLAA